MQGGVLSLILLYGKARLGRVVTGQRAAPSQRKTGLKASSQALRAAQPSALQPAGQPSAGSRLLVAENRGASLQTNRRLLPSDGHGWLPGDPAHAAGGAPAAAWPPARPAGASPRAPPPGRRREPLSCGQGPRRRGWAASGRRPRRETPRPPPPLPAPALSSARPRGPLPATVREGTGPDHPASGA